ncbi:MAG: nuclear transport factor 2 family protein [Mycobacteriaceae bacterium]|nr:nuclear transport factor 2 family protein [Mycobacteriaceae bacterium]
MDATDEFQQLLDDWSAAIVANDAEEIAAFAMPSWVLVDPAGGPFPSANFLAMVRSGMLTHSEMTHDVRHAELVDHSAVVISHCTNKGTWQHQPFESDEWSTNMFVRRDGKWLCAATALTPRDAAAAPNPPE